jgi:hypothetical protein
MTDDERDKLIVETANDVKWIKSWTVEHKQTHDKYKWYFISTIIGVILSFFRR